MHEGWKRWFVGIASVLALSCSEEATQEDALVSPVPLEHVTFRDTTIQSISGTTFKMPAAMDGSNNLVGRSGNYVAYTMIQFYPGYFDIMDTVNVLSATLTLHGASFFGDSTSTVGFSIYRTDLSWSSSTFTWDSLQSGLYDAGKIRGSYSGRIGLDTEAVSIKLDTTMAREWLATSTDTTRSKYGMILVPNQTTNVVRGFHTFESDSTSYYPTLRIITLNVAGTVYDTLVYNLGNDTFVGNIDNLNSRSDLFYLQSGVVYRGIIKFDVSFLPKGASIHKAELQIKRDPLTCRLNRFSGDSAIAAHVVTSETDYRGFEATYSAGRLMTDSLTRYSIDARRAVQSWLRGPNYGMLLRMGSTHEFSSFDLLTFYNVTAADATVRPRLKIIYTTVQ
jgi:hypothetical protein